jgi:hypothetical protein
MAVIRVEKNKNYTVMSNVHLRDKALSLKAKGLLSLILSLPDDWQYNVKGLAAISKEGRSGITSALQELEAAGYLERRQLRGEHGKLAQVEYVVFEAPRPPLAENPATAKPATADPATGNPVMEDRAQISTEEQITEKQNTDLSKYRFNSFRDAAEISAEEMRKERETYRQLILENIEYDILCQDRKLRKDDLDEIVEIMVDTVCANKPFIRVSGEDKPADVVKSRLLKLDSGHIQFVLDCMNENTTKVRNIRQYLLAALYNAPVTISNYYTSLVNHDMYGGGL